LIQVEVRKELIHHDIPEVEIFPVYLIDKNRPELRELVENAGKKIRINAIDTKRFNLPGGEKGDWQTAVNNAKSQLEYQQDRQMNLELLNKYGAAAFKTHNSQLEALLKNMEVELEETNTKITEINMRRKQDQVIFAH
jgi:pre-mRNA-splicing factor SPF27